MQGYWCVGKGRPYAHPLVQRGTDPRTGDRSLTPESAHHQKATRISEGDDKLKRSEGLSPSGSNYVIVLCTMVQKGLYSGKPYILICHAKQ